MSLSPERTVDSTYECGCEVGRDSNGAAFATHCPQHTPATVLIPTTVDALMQIIDLLWGELPADQVRELRGDMPEIVAACQQIHKLVNHSPLGDGGNGITVPSMNEDEPVPEVYSARKINPASWVATDTRPMIEDFRDGYSYATTQTNSIKGLSQIGPEDLFYVWEAINRGIARKHGDDVRRISDHYWPQTELPARYRLPAAQTEPFHG